MPFLWLKLVTPGCHKMIQTSRVDTTAPEIAGAGQKSVAIGLLTPGTSRSAGAGVAKVLRGEGTTAPTASDQAATGLSWAFEQEQHRQTRHLADPDLRIRILAHCPDARR